MRGQWRIPPLELIPQGVLTINVIIVYATRESPRKATGNGNNNDSLKADGGIDESP